jgi:hypothetical protein
MSRMQPQRSPRKVVLLKDSLRNGGVAVEADKRAIETLGGAPRALIAR